MKWSPTGSRKKKLSKENWIQLYHLAHANKSKAFDLYSQFYLSTDGQIYWSDTHQLSTYLQGYDGVVDQMLKSRAPGSLMLCEYYVPRSRLPDFFKRMGAALIETKANLIYGTVRFIEEDNESYLAWARQSYACTVINLRVVHDEKGIKEAKRQFRTITDIALEMDGSYFLTYHRWATKDQVLKAYPQFPQFIQKKLQFDPEERFQSECYRHYRAMFKRSE
jgi:FAD/FMN-containing dehydrogenase